MSIDLLALDVAILPPADVTANVIALSARLSPDDPHAFRLDGEHLPHVTLTQLFVRAGELDGVMSRIDGVLRTQPPLTMHVTGGGRGTGSVWIAVEPTAALVDLHHRLMEALRGFERPEGGKAAFFDGDARVGDVLWVDTYRLKASFGAFTPHITLGKADEVPHVEPFAFEAARVAACHLGRYCTCRRILREWGLK